MTECCICERSGSRRMLLIDHGFIDHLCDPHYIEALESIITEMQEHEIGSGFDKYKKKMELQIKMKPKHIKKKSSTSRPKM